MGNKIIFSYMREPEKISHVVVNTYYEGKRHVKVIKDKEVHSGGRIFGVLCAKEVDGKIYYGYSVCCLPLKKNNKIKKAGDVYDKDYGKDIAIARMKAKIEKKRYGISKSMPSIISKYLIPFEEKAIKYFK